ncbi:MAG: hypothetical protein A2Z14_02075 [Chloroflexi bacterium RBG_16_48_8]|nr:MAG: hypothetical protein A2Z14_02075 [Chloroflexi bacterium RBG_16_48_8]
MKRYEECSEKNSTATIIIRSILQPEKSPAFALLEPWLKATAFFRPFSIPEPYTSPKDIFCLREQQIVNGYRRISLFNHEIEVPKVNLREEVDIHMVPDIEKQAMQLRIWWSSKMVHSLVLPLQGFRVHL